MKVLDRNLAYALRHGEVRDKSAYALSISKASWRASNATWLTSGAI